MARVLVISSQVARGHVGLAAIVPALQGLGHEVIALPTVLLSNHPGHGTVAGEQVAPALLRRMLDALAANGWLGEIDAVMTGYLPSAEHVRFAVEAIGRVKARARTVRVLVDPVLGDEGKGLYIDAGAAAAIRDELVGLADVVTPNAFELQWLTGKAVGSVSEAVMAAAGLPGPLVLATSVAAGADALSTVLVPKDGDAVACCVPRRFGVPNGTGDFLAALYLGHELRLGVTRASEALALAGAGVDAVIDASRGYDELQLMTTRNAWVDARPLPVSRA
jgi:pyridoxine kinase